MRSDFPEWVVPLLRQISYQAAHNHVKVCQRIHKQIRVFQIICSKSSWRISPYILTYRSNTVYPAFFSILETHVKTFHKHFAVLPTKSTDWQPCLHCSHCRLALDPRMPLSTPRLNYFRTDLVLSLSQICNYCIFLRYCSPQWTSFQSLSATSAST